MKTIDLHTHTTASDGTFTPEELMDYALKKKLSAIAITDHDTIDGLQRARTHLGQNPDLELIPGIEFSSKADHMVHDVHILGLYVDDLNPVFVDKLTYIINSRNDRNLKIVNKLCQLGLPITIDDVLHNATDGVVTRAHFGKALLEKGYVSSMQESFKRYIGNDGPAYVAREKLTPQMAIEMILNCGGVPVLAHPTLYNLDLRSLEALIAELVSYGLKGIEGIYSTYTKNEVRYIGEFAHKYNLVITGGSDFHGTNKVGIDLACGRGNLVIPYDLLPPLKALAER